MRQQIYKVFGSLQPVSLELKVELDELCQDWNLDSCCTWEASFLHFDFAGIYFPSSEVLALIAPYINLTTQGKLDIINLEDWTLTRTLFQGTMSTKTVSLNQVLEYSGF